MARELGELRQRTLVSCLVMVSDVGRVGVRLGLLVWQDDWLEDVVTPRAHPHQGEALVTGPVMEAMVRVAEVTARASVTMLQLGDAQAEL